MTVCFSPFSAPLAPSPWQTTGVSLTMSPPFLLSSVWSPLYFSCRICSASLCVVFWIIYTDLSVNLVLSVGRSELRVPLLCHLGLHPVMFLLLKQKDSLF